VAVATATTVTTEEVTTASHNNNNSILCSSCSSPFDAAIANAHKARAAVKKATTRQTVYSDFLAFCTIILKRSGLYVLY
jgi:hypothetical protein